MGGCQEPVLIVLRCALSTSVELPATVCPAEEKPEAATPDGGPVDDMAVRNARRELLVRTKGKWAGFGDIIRVPTPPEPLLITE